LPNASHDIRAFLLAFHVPEKKPGKKESD